MLRIISHIERLLLVHDCVIVPKVGGFVLQDHPASFIEGDSLFMPAHKEIVFNPTLQHNDGLLAESYMKMHGTDYNQALLMIEEDTKELKDTLSRNHRISLGNMGLFSIGEEGNVIFEQNEKAPFSPVSYGLAEFHIPTLQALQQEKERAKRDSSLRKEKRDTIYIPVSVKFIRTAVASAAAVALFLLISTPVKDVNTSTYTASFIPSEVIMKTPLSDTESLKSTEKVLSVPMANVLEAGVKKEEPAVLEKTVSAEASAKTLVIPKKNNKYYHIVIGSFPTEKQANEFLSQVDKTQYANSGIVRKDGKVRVYAAKFTERKAAEDYITEIRGNVKYKDAWLFISR